MLATMQRHRRTSTASATQIERDELAGWIDGTGVATNDQTNDTSREPAGFAWSLYHHTLQLFSLLLVPTLEYVARSDRLLEKQSEKSLKKSLGRLFLWGSSFEGGKLESVLDESESLRETVLESLVAIGTILLANIIPKCLIPFVASEGQSIKQEMHELSILIEKARIITESDYESDGSTGSPDVLDDISAVIDSLGVYVGCLMELLPSMEETLSCLNWQKEPYHPSHSIDFQISGPAQPYVLKVYDKFPLADLRLMHRLGEANWQRHLSLRANDNQQESEVPQALPKITFVAVSEFHDSGLGSSLPARSSYAATVASHSSFQTTADDKNGGSLRVPPTPKHVSEGEPFSCQICGQFLTTIRNRVDWRRHVFADLKPYLCTFLGCKDEFKTFATRKQWEDHEFDQHRLTRRWACSACQHKSGSPEEWHQHLAHIHKVASGGLGFPLDSQLFEVREAAPIESMTCPLCLECPAKSRREFAAHVGRHMEGIALAALPRDCESTDNESNASDVSDSELSNGHLSLSDPSSLPRSAPLHSLQGAGSQRGREPEQHAQMGSPQGKGDASSTKVVASESNYSAASVAWISDDEGRTEGTKEQSLPRLSARASNMIHEQILKPLLEKASLGAFHPIIKDCPRRIRGKEIVCLRDLEKTLIFMAPEMARSAESYLEFGLVAIQYIQATVEFLSDSEQVRPHDRPYTSGYFVDLADQVKQYSQQIQAANEATAQEEQHEIIDKVILYGGLTKNGRPAELVRLSRDGKATSVATGLEVDVSDHSAFEDRSIEEAGEDEIMLRAMSRRTKSTSARDLAPQKCREPGCNKEFKRPVDLTKHEKTHSRPWKCPDKSCKYHEYGWPTEKELDRHHNDKHNFSQPLYECHFKPCPYGSKRESNCKQHMEKAHGWTYVRSKSSGKAKPETAVPPALDETTLIDEGFQGYVPEPLLGNDFQLFSSSISGPFTDRLSDRDLKLEKEIWDRSTGRVVSVGRCSDPGVDPDLGMVQYGDEFTYTQTFTYEHGHGNNPTPTIPEHPTPLDHSGRDWEWVTGNLRENETTASPNPATRDTPPPPNTPPVEKPSVTRRDDREYLELLASRSVPKD